MIWILAFSYYTALITLCSLVVWLVIDDFSHGELDQHNKAVGQRLAQAELADPKTKSRILRRPDL